MIQEETLAQRKRRKVRYALGLRKRMTETETILWKNLKNRQLNNMKFRRQVPVSWFIVDFICMERQLIIEVDGSAHDDQKQYDQERETELRTLGFTILRFRNDDIVNSLERVLETIKEKGSPLSR